MKIIHLGTQFISHFGLEDEDLNVIKQFNVPVTTNLLNPAAFVDAYQKLVEERNKLAAQHAVTPAEPPQEAKEPQ